MTITAVPGGPSMQHATDEAVKEPSPSKQCRTQQINAEFSNCLAVEGRYRCNYAFLFGDGYLCTHPNHRNFR